MHKATVCERVDFCHLLVVSCDNLAIFKPVASVVSHQNTADFQVFMQIYNGILKFPKLVDFVILCANKLSFLFW